MFESKVAAEFAYMASAGHPVMDKATWAPVKCPQAPPPCITHTQDGASHFLPAGAPTELLTCFVLSLFPKGQVAWQAVPGCMGLQAIDPREGAFAANRDTLVFETEKEGSAARELLSTAGFSCTSVLPSGNLCRTDTLWTYKEPRAPRSTVSPHMAVPVPKALCGVEGRLSGVGACGPGVGRLCEAGAWRRRRLFVRQHDGICV